MGNFSFYKKNTVLNNILKNYSVEFSNSYYLLEYYGSLNKELYSISDEFEEQYVNNISLKNPEYNDRSLFEILTTNFYDYYTANISNLSKQTITSNIKRYNNANSYVNISKYLNQNSFILDYSNKSYYLYYTTNNNLSLLSYNISFKNGFNYDETNHIIYFNIDNNYIKNINNILYFNYNKINSIDINNYGIFPLNKYELTTDHENNLILNSDFKFNIQSNIKKLKKLYDDSDHIYQKLDFYYNNDNYQDNLNIINSNKDDICIVIKQSYDTPYNIYIHENNVIPFLTKNDDNEDEIKYKTKFIKSVNDLENNYQDQYIINSNEFLVEKTGNEDSRFAYTFSITDNSQLTSYDITYVSYEFVIKYTDSNLYYTDNNYKISNLNLKNNNTIYTKNLNQVSFKILNNIKNIDHNNVNNFKNKAYVKYYNKNNIDLDLTYNNHIISYSNLNLISSIYNGGESPAQQHEGGSLNPSGLNPSIYGSSNIEINYGGNGTQVNGTSTNLIESKIEKISYKVCDSSSYTINISNNIDNIMFCNSGITLEYKESPYLTDIDENGTDIYYGEGELTFNNNEKYVLRNIHYKKYYQTIYIPLPNQLNINYNNNNVYKNHSVNKGIFNKFIYKTYISSNKKIFNNSYYILSSVNLFKDKPENCEIVNIQNILHPRNIYNYNSNDNNYIQVTSNIYTYKFTLNNYIINFLKSNNLIYSSYDLNYYSSYNYHFGNYNYYPILNNYPSKYINSKFFNIIKNSCFIDPSNNIYYNNEIPLEESLKSSISDIKTTKNDILYLYEIVLDSNLSYYINDKINYNYQNMLSYSFILFNTYNTNYNNTINNIITTLHSNSNNKKETFYNNLSSYIISTYINLKDISDSLSGRNNLKQYITTYSNNFIKFI